MIQLGSERLVVPFSLRSFILSDLNPGRWGQRNGTRIEDRQINERERVIAAIVVRTNTQSSDTAFLLVPCRQQCKVFGGQIVCRIERVRPAPGNVLLADPYIDRA